MCIHIVHFFCNVKSVVLFNRKRFNVSIVVGNSLSVQTTIVKQIDKYCSLQVFVRFLLNDIFFYIFYTFHNSFSFFRFLSYLTVTFERKS